MSEADLRAVVEIEESLYEFPWNAREFPRLAARRVRLLCIPRRQTADRLRGALACRGRSPSPELEASPPMRSAGAMGAACSSTWSESRESARLRSCSSKSGYERGGTAPLYRLRLQAGRRSARLLSGASRPRGRAGFGARSVNSIHECAERALPGRDGARSRVEAARAEAGTRTGDSGSGKKIRGKPLARAGGFETAAAASSSAKSFLPFRGSWRLPSSISPMTARRAFCAWTGRS